MINNMEDGTSNGLSISEFQGLVIRYDLGGFNHTETKVLSNGIILQAPNGSKRKLTVSNTGTLTVNVA